MTTETGNKAAKPLRVAVTGASGMIGTRLMEELRERGHTAVAVKRGVVDKHYASWDPKRGEIYLPGGADVLVHLAGRSVAARWTGRVRRQIWDSRVPATEKVCRALAAMPVEQRPKLMVSASAIGIYGDRQNEVLTEASPLARPKSSFLADVCMGWEAATRPAEDAGVRVIHPRVGVVLSRGGGALKKLLTPTKLFLGGPIGTGEQWVSWISLTDMVRMLVYFTESEGLAGAINAVSPGAVRQKELMAALGKAVGRPGVFPMPAGVVKLVFGEMGREVLLGSQRVWPERAKAAGFGFVHETIEAALATELALG